MARSVQLPTDMNKRSTVKRPSKADKAAAQRVAEYAFKYAQHRPMASYAPISVAMMPTEQGWKVHNYEVEFGAAIAYFENFDLAERAISAANRAAFTRT